VSIIDFILFKHQKNCLVEYVGTELSRKRGKTSLRADVFRVSNGREKIMYLCEGKKEHRHRNFGKVVGEAVPIPKYSDYVYVFGSTEGFETHFFLPSVKTLTKFFFSCYFFNGRNLLLGKSRSVIQASENILTL
jgi:hypothetical protein